MRMRQLKKDQSNSFWASFEAHNRIRKVCKLSAANQITNENVFEFIRKNSDNFEQQNMPHWAAAGVNYTKKLVGHKLYEKSPSENSLKKLNHWCVEDEVVKLSEMYGEKKGEFLKDITESKLNRIASDPQVTGEIQSFVEKMKSNMIQKLEKPIVRDMKKFTQK